MKRHSAVSCLDVFYTAMNFVTVYFFLFLCFTHAVMSGVEICILEISTRTNWKLHRERSILFFVNQICERKKTAIKRYFRAHQFGWWHCIMRYINLICRCDANSINSRGASSAAYISGSRDIFGADNFLFPTFLMIELLLCRDGQKERREVLKLSRSALDNAGATAKIGNFREIKRIESNYVKPRWRQSTSIICWIDDKPWRDLKHRLHRRFKFANMNFICARSSFILNNFRIVIHTVI